MSKEIFLVAGNLSNCLSAREWREIGTSPTVVNRFDQSVRIHFTNILPKFEFVNHKFTEKHTHFITNGIRDLLKSGAIERCVDKPHHLSLIGVVPKRNNKFCLIHEGGE